MNRAEKMVHMFDRLQQRKPALAFGVAVWKKFGDDQAGNLAAQIAFYAFASLFPLLLVLVTGLDIVLRSDAGLRDKVLGSAFGQFPVIGPQLEQNVHSLQETGAALVAGIVFTFFGARGVATAMQNALNTIWEVPFSRRPGFPWNQLRSVALVVAVGTGLIVTSLLSGLVAGQSAIGIGGAVAAVAVSLLMNAGLFWLGFRLATASEVSTRTLFPSAVLAGLAWQVLQWLGTYLVSHMLARSSSLYGAFGLVLGLLAWLFLQARITLYAVEAAVVYTQHLWPRSLAPPPLTPQDRRAYELYATAGQRRPEEDISVRISPRAQPGAGG
jgi:membrane protein